MHFELFFQKIGNLKHFVTDIKSKLRDEFSALMMLADAEEEILGSQESGKVMYIADENSDWRAHFKALFLSNFVYGKDEVRVKIFQEL